MRLIKCEIENFGKLSNVSLDFQQGFHAIVKENGWGKSTLSAFIKVMFYGFDNERTQDPLKKERRRYQPWQGGTYGGSLTFESKGKKYKVTRFFGAKEKDDTFELRNADTNLLCEDFSERIGEELFQIDGASFRRTIFISQNDCATEATDSINAKLGNLAEYTDDMNNFATVVERFKDMLNKMTARKKTGSLYIRKTRIGELKQEIKEKSAIQRSIQELTINRDTKKTEYENLINRQSVLEKQQHVLQMQKDLQVKEVEYKRLLADFERSESEWNDKQQTFLNGVPQEADLIAYGQMSQELLQLEQSLEHYRLLPREAEVLQAKVPDEQLVDACWERYPQLQELDRKILERETALNTAKLTVPSEKKGNLLWCVLGVVLAAFGIGAIFVDVKEVGMVVAILGVILAVLGMVVNKKDNRPDVFAEQENQIEALREERKELWKWIESRLAPYTKETVVEGRLILLLQEMRQKSGEQKLVKEKASRYEQVQDECAKKREEIKNYLQEYSIVPTTNLVNQFVDLREKLRDYKRVNEAFVCAKTAKESFQEQNDVDKILAATAQQGESTLEEIGNEMHDIREQLERAHQSILSYERQLEVHWQRVEELTEKEEDLALLLEEQEKEQKKYALVEKTKELMENAKVSFTQRYMAPIMSGFEKYYSLLHGGDTAGYQLDANTTLSVSEYGQQRDIRFLSAGYQDLLGLCMRLALVDAMYEGEKPFIIMDDPFVNLDDEKIQGGLRLLEEVAKEYQIVYFTCNEQRRRKG